MCANRLQLNTSNTEVIWCATSRRQQQLPTAEVRVVSDYVWPSKCVRNLGIFIDSDVTMRTLWRRRLLAAVLWLYGSFVPISVWSCLSNADCLTGPVSVGPRSVQQTRLLVYTGQDNNFFMGRTLWSDGSEPAYMYFCWHFIRCFSQVVDGIHNYIILLVPYISCPDVNARVHN